MAQRQFRASNVRSAIASRLSTLLEDPFQAAKAERLSGRYAGLRSARVNRSDRFIYKICRECRQLGDRQRWSIDCCMSDDVDDRVVSILYVSVDHYRDIPDRFSVQDES